jgi:hypothetical protein
MTTFESRIMVNYYLCNTKERYRERVSIKFRLLFLVFESSKSAIRPPLRVLGILFSWNVYNGHQKPRRRSLSETRIIVVVVIYFKLLTFGRTKLSSRNLIRGLIPPQFVPPGKFQSSFQQP